MSVLDDEYGRATVAMAALVDRFAALDLYDPERVKVSACAFCSMFYTNVCCSRAPPELQSLLQSNRAPNCMFHADTRS